MPSPQTGEQDVSPVPLSNPVGQGDHEVASSVLEKVPGVQGTQRVCATLEAVPANHLVHESCPEVLTHPKYNKTLSLIGILPVAQGSQPSFVEFAYVPPVHGVQESTLPELTDPK